MRVLVCGGRDFRNSPMMARVLGEVGTHRISVVIHGGAPGADTMAGSWASAFGVRCETYDADWSLGPKAGPIRNQRMIDEGKPDLVVAFPGGKGTADMVRRAKKAGIPVKEIA